MRTAKKFSVEEMKLLGKKIRDARQKNGLTLKELGKKIGYSFNTISEWECGKRAPASLTLLELKKNLKIKI